MSIRFKCPSCSKSIKITMALAGKKGKCPGCDKTLKMPSEEQLQKLMAKQAAAVGVTAPAAPAPPPQPTPAPASDDLFGDLSSSNFDDDDFNFPDPAAAQPEETYNPYASPLSEYKADLAASRQGGGYAGFWARVGAAIVDNIVTRLGAMAIEVVVTTLGIVAAESDNLSGAVLLLGALVVFLWLYYAVQESSASQATIGKRSASIKVTDLQGRPISFGRASLRFVAKLASILTFGIGYLMAAFTPKKQALHDMIAGTLVVKT